MNEILAAINVQIEYMEEQSHPKQGEYCFAYTVNIKNQSLQAFQLIARHWVITDADGKIQEVKGLGVIGQQPLLQPGQSFEYTSWAVILTPTGLMKGTYFCISEQAHWFDAPIPEFALLGPRVLH